VQAAKPEGPIERLSALGQVERAPSRDLVA
jgi:hypothetical protein